MNIKLIASLVAATILTGCSSSSGSKNEDVDPGFDNPRVGIENPIEKDDSPAWGIPTDDAPEMGINHIAISNDGDVLFNGEKVGKVDPSNGLVWKDGVLVGDVTFDSNTGSFTFTEYQSQNQYTFTINKSGVVNIDWENSAIDNGWDVQKPTPELPPTDDAPEMGINHITINDEGTITLNGEEAGTVDFSNGMVWSKDGELTGSVSKNNDDSSYTYTHHSTGKTFNFSVNKNGIVAVDQDRNTPEPSRFQHEKLSAEQKSQLRSKSRELRDAIKTKLERS